MIGRRPVLAGLSALLAMPVRAQPSPEPAVAALDAAAAGPDPVRALALLRGVDAKRLPPGRRLDLAAARAGLAVDADIRTRFGVDPEAKGDRPRDPGFIALLLRRKLGDTPGVEAGRRLVNREIARCVGRAALLFDRLGVPRGGVGERFAHLWQDERYLYADTDEGRDRAVAAMNATLARLREDVVPMLGPVPAYCLDVAARRSGIGAAPGTRTLPAPGREGFYTVDLDAIRRRPSWTLPSVVAHELLPGHMVQMPMEVAAAPHPLRLRYAPAFPEGWGIHAERLVAASGGYADDPHGELGYLHWRLFRLARARIDFARHLDGIGLDAARALMIGWLGEPAYFAPFDQDIARIAADPMTRAAECLCALTLDHAARRVRSSFYAAVLRHGRSRTEQFTAFRTTTGVG